MKKLLTFFTMLLAVSLASAQQELHIHHINIEDGDATMIGIYDTALHRYTAKILIDGGDKAPAAYLLPYLNRVAKGADAVPHFDEVILTHYHHDHLAGLTALQDGSITADSLIDPSGYDLHSVFVNQAGLQQAAEPTPDHLLYNMNAWTVPIKAAADHGFLKGHSNRFLSFGVTAKSAIGHGLVIGTVNGQAVVLLCVAGWGNTEGPDGIVAHAVPNPYNPNDYTLAFVLTCGQFRYFIGGDLGGEDNGEYIDQESPLTAYLKKLFPVAHGASGNAAAGHICGFKANHHGSDHSNDQPFMNAMMPAITITSAGSRSSWHLPSVGYLQRLDAVTPLSVYPSVQDSTYNRGVYFTNLQDFAQGASLTTAKNLFAAHPGISFDYGNAEPGEKAGYMIRFSGPDLVSSSTFRVYRADIRQAQMYTLLADFKCHER